MAAIELHPEALKELGKYAQWYERQATRLGLDFLDEVDRAFGMIQESPQTWPRFEPPGGVRRFLLHRFPFAILYSAESAKIHVWAVMHLRRRPGYWHKRVE